MSTDTTAKTQDELARLRRLHAESTDPLAIRLLQEIITEIETDLHRENEDGKGTDG